MTYMETLKQRTQEQLVNDIYNKRIASIASYNNNEKTMDKHGYGKRIPYIGWHWRNTDFIGKDITIGDCEDYIGVMENNKWGYAERSMTTAEVDTFIEYLERAFAIHDGGGEASQLLEESEKIFDGLWSWFQTLRHTGDWCSNYSWEYDA